LDKPTLFWVEQLVASRGSEIPDVLINNFSVRSIATTNSLELMIADIKPAAVFFDYDYPDRRRLSEFARIKSACPSVPVVMVTLQHSESLAIWAYRHGALDFLIKPIDPSELAMCIGRLLEIVSFQKSQGNRNANRFKPPIPSDVPNTPRSKKDRLSPAIYFVQQNYSERIYSDAMARLCGMSATHFSRAFKQTHGLTFQEFLLRYRVRQACQQLLAPTANIADIAYNVGFSDPSYFTRVFKRFVGIAPSDFTAANDDSNIESAVAENSDEKMSSTSQIVRALSTSFRP
jgi:AraC-like DNA-binding protein